MFTGLIEEIGKIKSVDSSGAGKVFDISASSVLERTVVGDSISVNGACLTVTDISTASFRVFASRVTCDVTTLGQFRSGDMVNLERAMSATARFGGHMVQGHVDGKGTIARLIKDTSGIELHVSAGGEIMRQIVPRGSVAVDGISLTVVSVENSRFSLYIIPESLRKTAAPTWDQGREVNIETDIIAKYIERFLSQDKSNSSHDDERLKRKIYDEGFA